MPLCECGCGGDLKSGQRFVQGHNMRLIRKPQRYSVNPQTGCWDWLLYKGSLGYGQVGVKGTGKVVPAHRFIYEQHKGPIPDGLELDHLCRNPSCVNPEHLEPIQHNENVRRGATTKLTLSKVQRMRQLKASGMTARKISALFAINEGHVSRILRHKYWK